jgi:hypothetical protein
MTNRENRTQTATTESHPVSPTSPRPQPGTHCHVVSPREYRPRCFSRYDNCPYAHRRTCPSRQACYELAPLANAVFLHLKHYQHLSNTELNT